MRKFDEKKTILCLWDYGINTHTGFSTVSTNLKRELKKQFGDNLQLDVVAINHFGEGYVEEDGTNVIPAQQSDPANDPFGRNVFNILLKENPYDGIFIITDIGAISPVIQIWRDLKFAKAKANIKQFKSILYFPLDGKPIRALIRDLDFFDVIATYTEYAKEGICELMPELRTKISVLPHGTNTKDFYPISEDERQAFRKDFFEDEDNSKFIISNINRNQPRKDIPSTIFAFIEARKVWANPDKKPFLYLHMNPKDPLGWDLRAIFLQTDLKEFEDYMLTPKYMENHEADADTLRKIYCASDLYITTSLGEGFGLTQVEAMSCKLPVIAHMNTSHIEIAKSGERAYPLWESYPFCSPVDNRIREQSNVDEAAEAIIEMERRISAGEHLEMVEKAYRFASNLTWENVGLRMCDYFANTY